MCDNAKPQRAGVTTCLMYTQGGVDGLQMPLAAVPEGMNQAVVPPRRHNPRLEAFKQAIEIKKVQRAQDFQERRSMSQKLSEHLRQLPSEDQKDAVRRSFNSQQDEYMRECRKPVSTKDFEWIKVIGTGAFGIVRLCRKKDTGEVFAMKQMKKKDMIVKNQAHHVRAEKDALSLAKDNWVIGLHYTFQDDIFLYMVMDYLPGGDLMTHLMRKDTFNENETRFYIAELVEAVDYIHTNLHYIHRDIKPDNIVFDSDGHILLLDFGLCKYSPPQPTGAAGDGPVDGTQPDNNTYRRAPRHLPRAQLASMVGTPDYMSPEVCRREPYGKECDWWSVGIIAFEMLFGGPPFSDERHEPMITSQRVTRWRQYFHLPADPRVGRDARDLLRGLICDMQDRVTACQIRVHPFFRGLDFSRLREMEPPIKPVVNGPLDTSNFDDFGNAEREGRWDMPLPQHQVAKDHNLYAFHDYGYRRDLESKKPSVQTALNSAVGVALGVATPPSVAAAGRQELEPSIGTADAPREEVGGSGDQGALGS